MPLLAFDRGRLDLLRITMGAALDDLRGVRSSDAGAAEVMRVIHRACRSLEDVWLPRVHDVLTSTAMTSCRRSEVGAADVSQATTRNDGWEVTHDRLPVFGPPAPGPPVLRTFDEVLADIRSGELVPMADPLDADGRAGAHYTSLSFAAAHPTVIGAKETTPTLLKIVDFFSDGLPVGWREEDTLTIYYLPDARVTSSAHVLSAFDRDEGPETLIDRTTEATVSGYLVVATKSTKSEVSVRVGSGDDTQSGVVASQTTNTYAGIFYPDDLPEFEPISSEPRYVSPNLWTFTKSAAPMQESWGTWAT